MISSFRVYLYGHQRGPIPSSFEAVAERLEQLPKLYLEGDGSFVWAPSDGDADRGKQQIYGMIYDAAGAIQYCELRGQCTSASWTRVIQAIAGDTSTNDWQVMRLPEQDLQNLQSFEQTTWTKTV